MIRIEIENIIRLILIEEIEKVVKTFFFKYVLWLDGLGKFYKIIKNKIIVVLFKKF